MCELNEIFSPWKMFGIRLESEKKRIGKSKCLRGLYNGLARCCMWENFSADESDSRPLLGVRPANDSTPGRRACVRREMSWGVCESQNGGDMENGACLDRWKLNVTFSALHSTRSRFWPFHSRGAWREFRLQPLADYQIWPSSGILHIHMLGA